MEGHSKQKKCAKALGPERALCLKNYKLSDILEPRVQEAVWEEWGVCGRAKE